MLAVVVRPRKHEIGFLVPGKFMPVAKELTVANVLSKILAVDSKIFSFYARLGISTSAWLFLTEISTPFCLKRHSFW